MSEPESSSALPPFPAFPPGTNVVSVGIDMESVSRIRNAIERHGENFLEKVFTPEEIELCETRGNARWASFAARWAAKEAFSKALGTGIGAKFAMTDVGIVNNTLGAPEFNFSTRAQAALRERGASRALLSLTHTRELAAAVVVFIK